VGVRAVGADEVHADWAEAPSEAMEVRRREMVLARDDHQAVLVHQAADVLEPARRRGASGGGVL
jgi:hypothetical protein